MGLDMYMSVKRFKYLKDGERTLALDDMSGDKFDDYKSDEFGVSNRITIGEQVCYWRKANAIHRWFVDNVQDGKDECQESYVSMKNLKELYDICKEIINRLNGVEFYLKSEYEDEDKDEDIKKSLKFNSKNLKKYFTGRNCIWNYDCSLGKDLEEYLKKNLPCGRGCFFGTYDYDGGYVYDIIKTILMFDRLFKKVEKIKKSKGMVDIYYQASW